MKQKTLKILQKLLGLLAKIYIKKTNPMVIWITGSVWKTSCRVIIEQTLKQLLKNKNIYSSPKNFNSELWIIFSIFEIETYSPWFYNLLAVSIKILFKTIFNKSNYNILLLEYWIDHPDDMGFLISIVIPDISIFTKLDSIHEENFKDIKAIWDEKFKLMKITKKIAYLNFQDEYCRNNYYWVLGEKKLYNKNDFKIKDFKLIKNDNTDNWKINSCFTFNNTNITSNILWEENANYISIWIDVLKIIDPKIDIETNIKLNYKLQSGRFSILQWINNSLLVDSSYNAWPESMKKMIENTLFLRDNIFPNYKMAAILWDMRELWKNTDELHKKLEIIIKDFDIIYTVWKEMKKNLNKENSFLSSKEAWLNLKYFLNKSKDKYIILFKWSQNTIFIEESLKQVLLNKEDTNKLVRQSSYWMKQKEKFWKTL